MVETHAAHCKMKSDVQSYNSYLSTVSRCRVRHLAIARGRRAGPGRKDRSRLRPSSNEKSASGGPLRDGKDGGMDGETGRPAWALYAPSRFGTPPTVPEATRTTTLTTTTTTTTASATATITLTMNPKYVAKFIGNVCKRRHVMFFGHSMSLHNHAVFACSFPALP